MIWLKPEKMFFFVVDEMYVLIDYKTPTYKTKQQQRERSRKIEKGDNEY